MLFESGRINRQGRVEDGNTTMDFDPEEIKRQISISSALSSLEWKSNKINIIDAPGYFDFVGEAIQSYYLADNALIVISALSGLEVGAEKAWDLCKKQGMPKAFFINQMDKEHANFQKVLNQLKEKYGSHITPIQLPIGEGVNFKGVVDVIDMKGYMFDGKKVKEVAVPEDIAAQAQAIRGRDHRKRGGKR